MVFPFRRPAAAAATTPAGAPPDTPAASRPAPLLGVVLMVLALLATLKEWAPGSPAATAAALAVPLAVALLALRLGTRRLGFVLVALAITAGLWAEGGDWSAPVMQGLGSAAFIGAFFTALATLRSAAESSPAIRACGLYLAQQPPGRRYAALTLGGQAFSVLLNYGSIALLGSLSVANAAQDKDPEIRFHRSRRMLLAVQRGFISILPFSPLSFAVAITGGFLPDAPYAQTALPALVTGAIVAGTGWAMDTIFKPRLSKPAPARAAPEGGPSVVLPLLGLLALLGVAVLALHFAFGVRVVGAVLVVVPTIALGWLLLQEGPRGAARRVWRYTSVELPGYRSELQLLMLAGYIGTAGAALLVPRAAALGLDLTQIPAPLLLAGLVWLIPLTGQIGMNPILSVSLLFPLLPSPEAMGVSPVALFLAITAGWTLSGITSPFTATTLLIGNFAGRSAAHVGLRWNGAYAAVTGALLTLWVLGFAFLR